MALTPILEHEPPSGDYRTFAVQNANILKLCSPASCAPNDVPVILGLSLFKLEKPVLVLVGKAKPAGVRQEAEKLASWHAYGIS